MKTAFFSCRCVVGFGALLVSFLAVEPLSAANKTWDGGGTPDGRWQTGLNWDLDTAPVANDLLFFGGGVNLASTNDFAAGYVVNNITFNVTASSFTLRGNAIVLTNSGGNNTVQDIGGSITNNSASGQTSRLNVTLAPGKHSIVNTAAGQLLLGGAWTRSTGAVVHFTSSAGSGAITLTNLANVNGILGGWANFNRTNWASVDGSGNIIAFSAYTDVAPGGIIASNPASNVRLGVGANVTLGGAVTTDINTLLYSFSTNAFSATNFNMNVDVGAGKILRLGSMGGISRSTNATSSTVTIGLSNAPGALTAGGAANVAGEIVMDSGAAGNTANTIVINSQIIDNGTGKVRLIKTGQGGANITCSTSNTFSGGIYVVQGRLQIQATNGSGTGPIRVLSGGQVLLSGVPFPNEFFISGIGTTEGGGNGAIRSGAGALFAGKITLESNSRISGGTSNSQALLIGRITGPYGLDLGSQGNVGGGGTGLLLLNPANDWTGNTALICRTNGSPGSTRIVLGADEVIPDGPGKGNVSIGIPFQNSQNTVALDMNGFDETINGLSIGGSSGQVFVWNSAVGTTSVLTIGNNDQSSTIPVGTLFRDTPPFSGVGGKLGIGKTGSGTLTLNGVNSYTGPTLVKGGVLVLAPGASISASTNINISAGAILDVISLSLASGQTISGNGMLRGEILASPGSTVSPGNSIGSLLVSNNIYLQGQTLMEIDATANTCDTLSSSNSLSYGGTLKVVIINGAPGPGASYKLFNAPNISGLFTTNLPPLDPGLAWRTNNLVSQGIIEVVQVGVLSPRFTTTSRVGTNLVMHGINGTNGATYYVLTSTNVAFPRSNWTRVATNVYGVNGAFVFTNGINPTRPHLFYMLQQPVP